MTKRTGLFLALGLLASMASMQATTVACSTLNGGTLAALITATNGTSGGTANTCTVDDKIFSNFSYVSATGAAASAVTVGTEFSSLTQNYGWLFDANFNGNFTLSYTVSIDTAICASCRINSASEQLRPGQDPPGTQTISVSEGGLGPVVITNGSFATQSNGMSLPGLLTLTKTATATNLDSSHTIETFESGVHQSTVPEPMTLSMMGIGLLGLGFMRRRQMGKK